MKHSRYVCLIVFICVVGLMLAPFYWLRDQFAGESDDYFGE